MIDFWGLVRKYFSPCGVALVEGIICIVLGLFCTFSLCVIICMLKIKGISGCRVEVRRVLDLLEVFQFFFFLRFGFHFLFFSGREGDN